MFNNVHDIKKREMGFLLVINLGRSYKQAEQGNYWYNYIDYILDYGNFEPQNRYFQEKCYVFLFNYLLNTVRIKYNCNAVACGEYSCSFSCLVINF